MLMPLHWFGRIKSILFPVKRLETLIPKEGVIADLGCGNGFFSELLASRGPMRKVIGYDWSQERLEKMLGEKRPNLEFRVADIFQALQNLNGVDHILISDVLYLIDFNGQEVILKQCYQRLPVGGTLILKICDTAPAWKFCFEKWEEWVAVNLFHISKSGESQFFHRSSGDYARRLTALGFEVSCRRLDQWRPYPHAVLICKKVVGKEQRKNG